jgi:hypothetical protein
LASKASSGNSAVKRRRSEKKMNEGEGRSKKITGGVEADEKGV